MIRSAFRSAFVRLPVAVAALSFTVIFVGYGHIDRAMAAPPEIASLPPDAPDAPDATPPVAAFHLDDASLRCLAQTIYFEARSEGRGLRRAVAHVVLNRLKDPRFPETICGVVHQGGTKRDACQFTWWCDGKSDTPFNKEAWAEALDIARKAARPDDPDPTRGALYFHDGTVHPAWARHKQRTATIGADRFYH